MVNISSINHDKFTRLHALTNNYNKTTLLDKLIYWWQISTYTLNDGNIWFTRSLDTIAADACISKRSVERYLREFELAGLIERTNRLFKKKHLYIRITTKLLNVICVEASTIDSQEHPQIDDARSLTAEGSAINKKASFLFEHNGAIDSANMAPSYYKDKDCNLINNITVNTTTNVIFDKNTQIQTQEINEQGCDESLSVDNNFPSQSNIDGNINSSNRLIRYIKGTLHKLETEHHLQFSNPKELLSQIIFSVVNTKNHFPGITNVKHRINIIAKLLRQNRWQTPKGFYNYCETGRMLKAKQAYDEHKYQQFKKCEGIGGHIEIQRPTSPKEAYLGKEYYELKQLINSERRYLQEMELHAARNPSPVFQDLLENIRQKLCSLIEKSSLLESQQNLAA